MAKKILYNASVADVEKLVSDFRDFLEQKGRERLQLADVPRYSFSFSLENNELDERKAILHFTPKAYTKMYGLVLHYNTEVQWHGLVKRLAENEFLVEDIVTFPHEVSEATATSDQSQYNEWVNNLPNEVYDKVRLHGHSHVNMACTPSVIDITYQKNMLALLETPNENNDVFYIFMIVNKRGDMNISIYDLQNNALYSTSDVTCKVEFDDGGTLEAFLAETAQKTILPKSVIPATQQNKNQSKGKTQYVGKHSAAEPTAVPAFDDPYGGDDYDEYSYDGWKRRWRY